MASQHVFQESPKGHQTLKLRPKPCGGQGRKSEAAWDLRWHRRQTIRLYYCRCHVEVMQKSKRGEDEMMQGKGKVKNLNG